MRVAIVLAAALLVACGGKSAPSSPAPATAAAPAPAAAAPPAPSAVETVTVRDPETERENARLRMMLLERSAQVAEADRQLDEATTEIVRAMARLRSLATRAEAASAMAEAEVTLQQLRGRAGGSVPAEARQAEEALRAGGAAFDAQNYGGAVYLATQAKRIATAARGRLAESSTAPRQGERAFALPVPITTTRSANLRTAPNGSAELVATVPAGTALTAYAWAQDWVRVTLADGRPAWVHNGLVRGLAAGGP